MSYILCVFNAPNGFPSLPVLKEPPALWLHRTQQQFFVFLFFFTMRSGSLMRNSIHALITAAITSEYDQLCLESRRMCAGVAANEPPSRVPCAFSTWS